MVLEHFERIKSHKYARLIRFDKPVGTLLALFPALWAVAFASHSWVELVLYSIVMFVGAFIARSAGCILNDIADRDFDGHVERTKNRPLASKEVSLKEAYKILGILGVVGVLMLCALPMMALLTGLAFIPLIAIYPYMKRVTYYPQVFMGPVFTSGALIGWFAVSPQISVVAFSLYLACILWAIGFDTIYGHQDKIDDEKLKLKSLSIKLGDKTSRIVWGLYQIMMIFIAVIGINMHMNLLFYIVLAFAAYYAYWQTATLDINNPADCAEKFQSNVDLGFIIWGAILLGKLF